MQRNKQYDTSGPISYAQVCQTSIDLGIASEDRTGLGEIILGNNSGSTIDVGLGYIQPNGYYKVGQWDDSDTGSEYKDDTVDAQDAGTDDVALQTVSVNNDGFLVQSIEKFGAVQITVTTAESGGSPVSEVSYWNGSAWTSLTQTITLPALSSGFKLMAFVPPHDWAVNAGSGTDTDKYSIRVRYTTAPSSAAALASLVAPVTFKERYPSLATGNEITLPLDGGEVKLPKGAQPLPFFSTANVNNSVKLSYRAIPQG